MANDPDNDPDYDPNDGRAPEQHRGRASSSSFSARFECPICNKTFYSMSNLNQHKRVLHDGQVYVCPVCNVTHTSKHRHVHHLRRLHPNWNGNVDNNIRYKPRDSTLKTREEAKDELIGELRKVITSLQAQLTLSASTPLPPWFLPEMTLSSMSPIRNMSYGSTVPSSAPPPPPASSTSSAPSAPSDEKAADNSFNARSYAHEPKNGGTFVKAESSQPSEDKKRTVVIKIGKGKDQQKIVITS